MTDPSQCPTASAHGNPWRYCPNCSWREDPERQPSPILRYFAYDHLPEKLQSISAWMSWVATRMDVELPDGPEKSAGLRKLLEAKDAFVRAALPAEGGFMHCKRNEPETCECVYCQRWREVHRSD